MKKIVLIIICASIMSCQGKKDADETSENAAVNSLAVAKINTRLLIIPGKSIGNIELEATADNLSNTLGKPDLTDAAMGKAWLTWFSKVSDTVTGNELNVYTEYKNNELREKVVRQIRVTSAEFQTKEHIRTGLSLEDISKFFPTVQLVGRYDVNTPYPVAVYDAVAEGIAFETEENKCTGIIIHRKGQPVSKEYITFHPDMMPM